MRSAKFSLNLDDIVEFKEFLPLDGRTDEEWQEIAEHVTDYPWARDLLASKDGSWTMLIAEIERPLKFTSSSSLMTLTSATTDISRI